jgi:hypothetical protein
MPSASTIEKVLGQIGKSAANYEHFFSQLKSAKWIAPLKEKEFFTKPPEPEFSSNGVRFPFWPETQYLARVAALAPEQVFEVIMGIPETDNVRVHEDLAQAAVCLPANLAARWASREAEWIDKQDHLFFVLPTLLGQLTEKLAISGQRAAAFDLAASVLRLVPAEGVRGDVGCRFDPWLYERILKENFPEIIKTTRLEGLSFLCDLLEKVVAERNSDASFIWRPAIEPHEQNFRHGGLRDLLIDAVRDGGELLVERGTGVPEIVDFALQRGLPVFQRLALHFAHLEPVDPVAGKLVCNRGNFFDFRLRHEYARLLTATFQYLDSDQKGDILSWIDEGPQKEDEEEKGLSVETKERRKRYWQAGRLSALRGLLPAEKERLYEEIVSELGVPEHPDFVVSHSFSQGPTGPKTDSELVAMTAGEIQEFLQEWSPSGGWDSPTRDGLGRSLKAVVVQDPWRFVDELDAFQDVDPTYVRAILEGVKKGAKSDAKLNWVKITGFLQHILEKTRNPFNDPRDQFDSDPHWGWARRSAAELVSAGLETDAIEFALRGPVWKVIDAIADDPDPTPEDDADSTMDPATHSINSTRGVALHTVFKFAAWAKRGLLAADPQESGRTFNLGLLPEVKGRLERHLDVAIELSPTIRAVYGQWFPWLTSLDRDWAVEKKNTIFSADNQLLWDAAWHAYVVFSPVYNEVFELLKEEYFLATDKSKLVSGVSSQVLPSQEIRLGEHLMTLVGRGVLGWGATNQLLERFFENGPVHSSGHALSFVGRSLYKSDQPVRKEVVERFAGFWDDLTNDLADWPGEKNKILQQFGWWFASGVFSPDWVFPRLKTVIEVAGGIDADFFVGEQLEKQATGRPGDCLIVLDLLASKPNRRRVIFEWQDHARNVLRAALENEATKASAERLVHKLGAMGFQQFRDLLTG